MDYKDTRLDKVGKHKEPGQVNDTNIQDNWTSQDKYNGWQYKWTSKQKQLCGQYVNMWLCVQLYAILDVGISLISVNNKLSTNQQECSCYGRDRLITLDTYSKSSRMSWLGLYYTSVLYRYSKWLYYITNKGSYVIKQCSNLREVTSNALMVIHIKLPPFM